VIAKQRRNGVLFCFVDDDTIEIETNVEFHHIKPFSEDGPTEIANIGAVSEFISERNRTRKNPLSISILEKTFIREFVLAPPTDVEFESANDFREEEKNNLVRLLSLVAEKQLVNRWNPDANNAAHQKAERIFSAGAMRAWVPMLRDVVAQVLHLYGEIDRNKVLFRQIDDQQWGLIGDRLERLFAHKIWDDPNPEVASQFKVNAVEQVRGFMLSHGLTVNWVLGGSGA
jgi:hypothetical protein